MTVFFAIIDREAAGGRSDTKSPGDVQGLIERTVANYHNFVGKDYESAPTVEAPTARKDVHVVSWQRHLNEGTVQKFDNYWAITGGHQVAAELVKNVRPVGGLLAYTRPVWGHYATIFGTSNRSQIYAWNTTPALEPIHWAATDEYVIISNRQLLAAFCLAACYKNNSPELSHAYLGEYLLYGYSLSGQTPFQGVRTLAVNDSLSITLGELEVCQLPGGLRSALGAEHTVNEGAEALASSLANAMDRTEKELAGRPVQLRLSGGKDSRLLLALMRNRTIDFRAVTFGTPSNPDVKLATHLCDLMGVSGEVRAPRPTQGRTVAERLETTLKESGGIPASEPHTAQYKGADPERPFEAIMMGQWPLYKGGLARRMRSSREQIEQTLVNQGGSLVNTKVRTEFDERLLDWSNDLSLNHDLEKLYLFAREFRSGRYLHAHVEQYAASSMLAYPIADAEVAAVCDVLSMFEKVSEKALFGALERIWPDIMKVPLDRSKWLFEAGGPDPEFSGPWYEHRYSEIPHTRPKVNSDVKRVVSEYSKDALIEMSSHLVNSSNFDNLCMHLTDDMVSAIELAARNEISIPRNMSERLLIKYVWRVCMADVWLSGNWIDG